MVATLSLNTLFITNTRATVDIGRVIIIKYLSEHGVGHFENP